MARKSMLEKELNRAQVINFEEVSTDSVNIGTEISLKDAKGKTSIYTILGAWDGDPKKNILSYKTPLASEMLGKKVGDSVALPSGQVLSIEAIKRWKA
jgi:transcription elongation GreA/GreB family factor